MITSSVISARHFMQAAAGELRDNSSSEAAPAPGALFTKMPRRGTLVGHEVRARTFLRQPGGANFAVVDVRS